MERGIASKTPKRVSGDKPLSSSDVDPCTIPAMDELLSSMGNLHRMVKIGEGSYGEVFKQGSLAYKIVPIEGQHLAEMTGEALAALTLSGLRGADCTGPGDSGPQNAAPCFVGTSRVAVCHGPYPRLLAKAWHKWDEQHGSENEPVDGPGLGPGCAAARSQLYLVLAMEDAGRDLEKHVLSKGMEEAKAILVQTAFTLAVGEAAVEFEHRDLHWGNLLLRPAAESTLGFRLQGQDFKVQTQGIHVSLIDFTASRLVAEGGQLAYYDLAQDPEVFQGPQGEIQFDTYRVMQALTGGNWAAPCPGTNCLWMAYLAGTLAAKKMEAGPAAAAQRRQLEDFSKRCPSYSCCQEMLEDKLLRGMWAPA